ncbi:telomere-protecting terminal protein Tpg [Streptomyces flaveolus]|uniref:telomere-protecting terminal protein Tpg n=1 Tax=Streptomyces flaveolus TaxID=67297 RepID=UPI0037008CAE
MSQFGDSLDAAVQKAFTRPAPKGAGTQMRYLVKQLKGTKAVAQLLRVSQRTVERYVKDQIKKPRPGLAARMEREVMRRWQPQIRASPSNSLGSSAPTLPRNHQSPSVINGPTGPLCSVSMGGAHRSHPSRILSLPWVIVKLYARIPPRRFDVASLIDTAKGMSEVEGVWRLLLGAVLLHGRIR